MLCQKCNGSGKFMGIGFVTLECPCDDEYESVKKSTSNEVQIDKRSKSYREAITRLMSENDLSREEAIELFEEEFKKIA